MNNNNINSIDNEKNKKFEELNSEYLRISNKLSINSSNRNYNVKNKIKFDHSINGYFNIINVKENIKFNANNIFNKNTNINVNGKLKNQNNIDKILNKENSFSLDSQKNSIETNDNFIYQIEEIYEDGKKFYGEVINKKKNGKGKLILKDNSCFEGQWVNDKITGFGILKDSNNKIIFKGNFFENMYDGAGTLFYNNDNTILLDNNYYHNLDENFFLKYNGLFKNNLKDGIGYIYFTNGDVLLCEFKGDKCNGLGVLFFKNKNKFFGIWENNKLVKKY